MANQAPIPNTIFAASYQGLMFTLEQFPINSIRIITTNKQIIQFCIHFKIEHLGIKTNSDTSIKGIIKYKSYIKSIAKPITKSKIHFCHNSFDIWGLYLVSILKSNNKVFYCCKDTQYVLINGLRNLISKSYRERFAQKLIYLIIIQTKFDIFRLRKKIYFLGINNTRLTNNYLPYNELKNRKNWNANIKQLNYHMHNLISDIILIDFDSVNFKINFKEIINVLKELNVRIAIKPHPTIDPLQPNLYKNKFFNDINKIPSYIPVEFLGNKNALFIGVYSTALKYLSKHSKVISIYEMVEWESNQYKQTVESNFLNSSEIIKPKNLKEFKTEVSKFKTSLLH